MNRRSCILSRIDLMADLLATNFLTLFEEERFSLLLSLSVDLLVRETRGLLSAGEMRSRKRSCNEADLRFLSTKLGISFGGTSISAINRTSRDYNIHVDNILTTTE